MTKAISSYSINKQLIPNYLIKELNVSKISDDLKHNLLKDGYLFIRNIYNKGDIKNAKDFILKHLHKVGEVKDPYYDGVFSGLRPEGINGVRFSLSPSHDQIANPPAFTVEFSMLQYF